MVTTRDELKIPQKEGIYYPTSIEDVQSIVQYAIKNKATVRTLGATHSPVSSIYAESDKEIKVILDKNLRTIFSFKVDESKESDPHAIVQVGAGCYLGINPKDSESTEMNSFNYQINERGYALPMLGGISHQSIAGFLSTSSSGGSPKNNIADVLQAIGFVNGKGEYIQARQGEDLFNALGVSMGLLGIITDVTFKVPAKYLVEGTEINQRVKDSCLAGDSKSDYSDLDEVLFENADYCHLDWYPHDDRITLWTGNKTAYDSDKKIVPYKHVLGSEKAAKGAAVVLRATNLLNEAEEDHEEAIALMEKPFAPLHSSQSFCDIWYKALPIDDMVYDLDGLMSMSFAELWFPRKELNTVMGKLKELFKTNPKAAGNLPTEIYSAKASPFWLSPSYGGEAIRFDFWWWDQNRYGEREKFFGAFYETIPGSRFHWGKYLPVPGKQYGAYTFKPEDLQKNYPKLNDFLKLRESMDPDQLFVTDYWRHYLGIPALKAKPEPPIRDSSWGNYLKSYLSFNLFSASTEIPEKVKTGSTLTRKP